MINMMGMCENVLVKNCIIYFVRWILLNLDVQLHHCVISLSGDQKKIFFLNKWYEYKITVVPFIKMLNFQSAFMASSWIKNINDTNFPKIHDFCEIKE